ncbi:MAG: small multi-drug export protein [Candidatus Thermoplasmatota archaeon]|nr:small multi-drug export protein [Candidatus Thermoplasmatota archaeon]
MKNKVMEVFLKIIAVPAIVSLVLYIMYLLAPAEAPKIYGIMAAYAFTPAGHLVILGGPALGITFWQAVLSITFMDSVVSLFIILNFDLLRKAPFIGPRINSSVEKARNWLEKWKWLAPLEFAGIIIFVAIPFPGTGALIGTLIARLLGMSGMLSFAAVSIGGFLISIMFALPAYGIARIF